MMGGAVATVTDRTLAADRPLLRYSLAVVYRVDQRAVDMVVVCRDEISDSTCRAALGKGVSSHDYGASVKVMVWKEHPCPQLLGIPVDL